ncbi:MAG: hypothetical protein GY749_29095 [Desulfobacteraceae bacterium]|nr:hypothetical protein [Desulfobacteraceae bacterium]
MELNFNKEQLLSVHFDKVPLKLIFEKIGKEKGVWFGGDEAIFEEKISVQFKELSLEEGLKRILAFMNYSLMFDQDGKLNGVVIVGKREAGLSGVKNSSVLTWKIKVSGNTVSFDNHVNASEIESLRVIKNCSPPGGPAKISKEALKNLKVIKNYPLRE